MVSFQYVCFYFCYSFQYLLLFSFIFVYLLSITTMNKNKCLVEIYFPISFFVSSFLQNNCFPFFFIAVKTAKLKIMFSKKKEKKSFLIFFLSFFLSFFFFFKSCFSTTNDEKQSVSHQLKRVSFFWKKNKTNKRIIMCLSYFFHSFFLSKYVSFFLNTFLCFFIISFTF